MFKTVDWKFGFPQATVASTTVKFSYLSIRSDWESNLESTFGDYDNTENRRTLGERLYDEGTGMTVDTTLPSYTFTERNPNRLDITEKHWLNTFPLPFGERAIALSFGEEIADVTWNVLFTDRDEFRNCRQALRTKRDYLGKDAMTGEEPEIVPFVLFMGYVDEANTIRDIRFGYYESINILREGRRGDNIIEAQIHFKDVTPHIYSKDITTDIMAGGVTSSSETNSGKASVKPERIKVEGVYKSFLFSRRTPGTGFTYTLPTSINEGVTHRVTFIPYSERIGKIVVNFDTDGGQDVTLTLHDSSNNSLTTETKSSVGTGEVAFSNIKYRVIIAGTYHIHLTVPSGTTKLISDTANNLEGTFREIYVVELGRNVTLYTDADTDNKFRVGRESVDKSQPNTDKTVGLELGDAANTVAGMTFQPEQTEISKVMLRIEGDGNTVNHTGDLRMQLFEYDTSADDTTGAVLATAYPAGGVRGTDPTDIYFPLKYSSLDTTKTYIIAVNTRA